MEDPVVLFDRRLAEEATALIERYGPDASAAAAARADSSRDRGNVVHFCRWRQIERFIAGLEEGPGQTTIH